MDGIIDSLIGFLPVTFAVLWVFRLVSRRKKKQAAKVEQPGLEPEPEQAQKPVQTALGPRVVQTPLQSRRLVRESVSPDTGAEASESKVSDVAFIKELSPLAQGMVWSVILDKPLSLKEPEL